MSRDKSIIQFLALSFLICFLGCEPSTKGRFEQVPPEENYTETVKAERVAREQDFHDDPESPLLSADRQNQTPLNYFDPDPSWRYRGTLTRYPTPSRLTMVTTSGIERPCARIGWLSFVREGQIHALQVYRMLDTEDADLFLPFSDPTNDDSTYEVGRYLNLVPLENSLFELDFNQAYNPSCAYGDPSRFVCPVPPRENRLLIPVLAGEKRFNSVASENAKTFGTQEGAPQPAAIQKAKTHSAVAKR